MTYFCIIQLFQRIISYTLLQQDIDVRRVWSLLNYLSFNVSKCKSMVLSHKRLKTQPMHANPSIRLITGESRLLQISWTKNQMQPHLDRPL